MKLIGAIGTAVLSVTLGVGIPAWAQQEQHEQQEENKDRPAQEKEQKAQPEKTAKPEEKNARQEDTRQEEKNAKPEERNAQQEKNAPQQRAEEAKPVKPEEHAGGKTAGRIPDDRYRAHFGSEHRFHVSQADYRNRRFQYGGYWFGFEGAWPSNWLYTQDVYVIEINGVYYLCNANYPGVNITLNVTL